MRSLIIVTVVSALTLGSALSAQARDRLDAASARLKARPRIRAGNSLKNRPSNRDLAVVHQGSRRRKADTQAVRRPIARSEVSSVIDRLRVRSRRFSSNNISATVRKANARRFFRFSGGSAVAKSMAGPSKSITKVRFRRRVSLKELRTSLRTNMSASARKFRIAKRPRLGRTTFKDRVSAQISRPHTTRIINSNFPRTRPESLLTVHNRLLRPNRNWR